MTIASAITKHGNNICHKLHWLNGDKNISHHNIKSWFKTFKTMTYYFIWPKTKFKIIYNNIPHTPAKVGVMISIIFSHTLDEAMSVGLVKACALRKIYSVTEKISA